MKGAFVDSQHNTKTDGVWLNYISMHPQNESFAAVGSDGLVYVWEFPSGELLATLEGHTGEILTVAYNPDGTSILTGGVDHTLRLWDSTSLIKIRVYEVYTGAIIKVAFKIDGSRFVSSSGDATLTTDTFDEVDRTIRIWDTATGEQLRVIEPQSGFIRAVAYAPDGSSVALGVWDGANGGTIRIYDA